MRNPTQSDLQQLRPDCLHDRVILITGAGAGIGKAAALSFAQAGAHIILLGRTQEKLEAVYDEIEATTATEPTIFPYDLNQLTGEIAREMAYAVEQQYGRLDGLLLNASLLGSKMAIAQYPEQQWNDVMNVNVNSGFYLTQAFLPLLEAAKHGRIVFTSSGVGREGRAYWGAYAVSKFATEGLMQILANELGNISSIRTFAINPGGTRTAMRASAYPGENPDSVPTPESHMPLYRFLFSEAASAFNGLSLDAYEYL